MEAWHEPYASQRTRPDPRRVAGAVAAAARVPRRAGARDDDRRGPRDGRPLRRGRGVGARGGLRRRPARLGERQAARPVPLAVLQPAHRRVRRLARERARAVLRLDPRGGRRAGRRRLPVHGEGPGRDGAAGLPARDAPTTRSRLCRLVEEWGFDAVTPVEVSVFPDTTLSRGGVPDSFWTNPGIADAASARPRRPAGGAPSSRPARGGAASGRRSRRCGTATCSRR